jgi:superfamily II DNA helicase RecQ
MLRKHGVNAAPYHKGVSNAKLDLTLQQWVDEHGPVDCIVATVAFGMVRLVEQIRLHYLSVQGIDKANVRYVVHYDLPKSFEGENMPIGDIT